MKNKGCLQRMDIMSENVSLDMTVGSTGFDMFLLYSLLPLAYPLLGRCLLHASISFTGGKMGYYPASSSSLSILCTFHHFPPHIPAEYYQNNVAAASIWFEIWRVLDPGKKMLIFFR